MNVLLPTGWREVAAQGARAFRPRGTSGGWLHLSLHPPKPELCGNDAAIASELDELLSGLGLDLGRCVHRAACDGTLGRMATSVWKSPQRGLSQFWIIPDEILIFASYTMGNLRTVQQEMLDAQAIVESIHITDDEAE